MRRFFMFWKFIGLLAFFYTFAMATSQIRLEGMVTDLAGFPIENAQVRLVKNHLNAYTDSNGYFLLFQEETDVLRQSNFAVENPRLKPVFKDGFVRLGNFDLKGRVVRSSLEMKSLNASSESLPRLFLKTSIFEDSLVVSKEGFLSQSFVVSQPVDSLSIVLDSLPLAAILKRGAGSSNQIVEQGAPITEYFFDCPNAKEIKITGVPAGILAVTDSVKSTISFSGKAEADTGLYVYTIRVVGEYNAVERQGSFRIVQKTIPKIVPDGYAMVNGVTTGGEGGDTVEVSSFVDFKKAVQAAEAKVVVVKGTVKTTDGDGYGLRIAANKTIMGKDSSATIYGGLAITGVSNVIVYNLNIHGTYPNPGPSDGIAVNNSHHVFLSHLNIWDAEDGNLDITNQSSYVTVFWVKFWYTDKNHPHRLNGLIGSGAADHPEDYGKLKVTYHHNWFSTLVNERMPRVMYGNAHIFNNYYHAPGNLYCIGVGSYASVLIEGNYFKEVQSPHLFMYNIYANIVARNNEYDNVTGNKDVGALGERYITTDPYTLIATPVTLDSVPYEYELDKAEDVPQKVMQGAGPHSL